MTPPQKSLTCTARKATIRKSIQTITLPESSGRLKKRKTPFPVTFSSTFIALLPYRNIMQLTECNAC